MLATTYFSFSPSALPLNSIAYLTVHTLALTVHSRMYIYLDCLHNLLHKQFNPSASLARLLVYWLRRVARLAQPVAARRSQLTTYFFLVCFIACRQPALNERDRMPCPTNGGGVPLILTHFLDPATPLHGLRAMGYFWF